MTGKTAPARVLVIGASGKIGRLLHAAWTIDPPEGILPTWQTRATPVFAGWIEWDPLSDDRIPDAEVVLMLAGVTSGTVTDLSSNARLAAAVYRAAARTRVRHVFVASSAAVYGATSGRGANEAATPAPLSAYGKAKLEMEMALRPRLQRTPPDTPRITALRIGNVVGADQLSASIARARQTGTSVILDQFSGGKGPLRSAIGAGTLGRLLARLSTLAHEGKALPEVLNVAAPVALRMESVLGAAAQPFKWRKAPATAIETAVMNTGVLQEMIPIGPDERTAATMIAQWNTLDEVRA